MGYAFSFYTGHLGNAGITGTRFYLTYEDQGMIYANVTSPAGATVLNATEHVMDRILTSCQSNAGC
ncbi:MAG: hypothetical protein U5K54_18400 [Cytophagales bacterium]|nr:hypothetical protein [Cytophagales bacterium]